MRRSRAAFLFGSIALSVPAASVACGSRTGLLTDEPVEVVTVDSGRDAGRDTRPSIDRQVGDEEDALPTLDVRPRPDVIRNDCIDAGDTQIYVVASNTDLVAFYPPTGEFKFIGKLACPDDSTPFSMAVDRRGIAYVLYGASPGANGHLFRVSTATAACATTPYVPGQLPNFDTFGMGFASDEQGPAETLYIANTDTNGGRLGAIDTTTFKSRDVGKFVPQVFSGELTGTGDGRLYTFYSKSPTHALGAGSAVAEIDKTSAKVIAEAVLPTVEQGNGWAFAFWGGDFYLFTSSNGTGSDVTRFRPSDGSVQVVASYPAVITGAGVSTCAPAQ